MLFSIDERHSHASCISPVISFFSQFTQDNLNIMHNILIRCFANPHFSFIQP